VSKHIILVDDDDLMRRGLAFSMEQVGYRVTTAENAEDGLAIAERDHPDLFVLDIGLPGMDGLQALHVIQTKYACPVIFLTARRRELDEILGLELGADDYITKPFDTDVLLARIKLALRHNQAPAAGAEKPRVITIGDITIDPGAHTVIRKDKQVDLPPREFDLLHALALDAGNVVSVDNLIARVWGAEYSGESQVVYVHIRWLREKLEDDPNNPQRIKTIRGVGYKLET